MKVVLVQLAEGLTQLAGKSKIAREGKLLVKNIVAKMFPVVQVKEEEAPV